jgi:predicted TIM-barrel fold metal-dependent hydrolase
MDEQGLDAALLFPTVGVCLEHFMKDDPDQLYANVRAFNRWLDEDWGYAYQDRIYAAPLLSLLDVDRAVVELDEVLARGARIVSLRPGPAYGRSPADLHFDPFWARLNEARVPVAFHIAESGYNELVSVQWGEEPNPSSHKQSAFQWSCMFGDRPIMDTLAALIFGNLFGRFENVNVISVENGSLFVPYLMKVMDKMGGMGRNGPWPGGRIREKPSAIFRRHVFVSPYHEEDVVGLVGEIGASQVLFGSDFPHAEGLADPVRFEETIATLPAEQRRLVMRENASRLLGRAWVDPRRSPGRWRLRIAQRIENEVLDRALRPGYRLAPEARLTERYRVSRAVLYEAIRLVERHQLATTRRGAGGGFFVVEPAGEAVAQLMCAHLDSIRVGFPELFEALRLVQGESRAGCPHRRADARARSPGDLHARHRLSPLPGPRGARPAPVTAFTRGTVPATVARGGRPPIGRDSRMSAALEPTLAVCLF